MQNRMLGWQVYLKKQEKSEGDMSQSKSDLEATTKTPAEVNIDSLYNLQGTKVHESEPYLSPSHLSINALSSNSHFLTPPPPTLGLGTVVVVHYFRQNQW